MSWKATAEQKKYDEETFNLLEITVYFLTQFFGYSKDDAEKYLTQFLKSYSEEFSEDDLHKEGSYYLAAIIHYLFGLEGRKSGLHDWLVENINSQEIPYEAVEYFNKHYFQR